MTKFKTIAAALAALTLAAAFSAPAQAKHFHHGWGLGAAIATGALIGIAAANSAPVYDDVECRYVSRYDRWGNLRTVRVCDAAPY